MRNRGWALFLLLAPSLSIPFEVLAQSRQGKTPSKALVGTTLARSDPCYQRLAATEKLTSYAITIPPRGSTLLGSHPADYRSEEHTSELQSRFDLVCRLLLEKKK